MYTLKNIILELVVALLVVFNVSTSLAQNIPSPKEYFGFDIGDDYTLATYTQTEAYFKKLAVSARTKLFGIGLTEEGRNQFMLVISSPENIKNLAHYKEISQKLGRAEGLSIDQAKDLAEEGKSVVWIDGGLHGTEVVGAQQLIEIAWQLVNRNDKETLEILKNDIILLVPANPDGQELVSSWYMREKDPKKRKTNIPRLYHKYVGHDNNRDFYMLNMKESQNISQQLYVEWIPQIIYDHHQSGPAGSVLAGPPYRDPFNYVYDPLLVTSIDAVGAAMNNRLNSENKPGFTQRSGSPYSTWWNGSLRTTPYFHNIIGILTEIIGNPTPAEIPLVPDRLIPNGATPNPVTPQNWRFRQSIEYSVSLNYAVLNYASRNRSDLLFNIYRMGMNSIERGSSDHWSISPKRIEALKEAYKNDTKNQKKEESKSDVISPVWANRIPLKYYNLVLKDSTLRDPKAYILPSDQADFPVVVSFINALIRSGILVHKSVSDFSIAGKKYPAGSYIIKTAQAFRPHVMDMFEPQDHPNDFLYPGGPPIPPYDVAGWTLAYQMGVKFDRVINSFEDSFQRIPYGEIQHFTKETITGKAGAGYVISPHINNAFIVVNDLLKAQIPVYRLTEALRKSTDSEPGMFYIPKSVKAGLILANSASDYGVKVTGINRHPTNAVKIVPTRIAIWNKYGGSMQAGWISWIMEQYHFPFEMVYLQQIDSGRLREKYDVIIFASGAIPTVKKVNDSIDYKNFQDSQPKVEEIPEEYRGWIGKITVEKSIPQLQKFLEEGGVIVALESSTNLAYHLKLPVKNALLKINDKGQEDELSGNEYFIPGSLVTADLDTTESANWGMSAKSDFNFDHSAVFKLEPDAAAKGTKKLVWFSNDAPLHSGWALGQKYLKNGVLAFVAPVGAGKLYAFGSDIVFRAQSHGTFKLLFNQLYQRNSCTKVVKGDKK